MTDWLLFQYFPSWWIWCYCAECSLKFTWAADSHSKRFRARLGLPGITAWHLASVLVARSACRKLILQAHVHTHHRTESWSCRSPSGHSRVSHWREWEGTCTMYRIFQAAGCLFQKLRSFSAGKCCCWLLKNEPESLPLIGVLSSWLMHENISLVDFLMISSLWSFFSLLTSVNIKISLALPCLSSNVRILPS